MKRLCSYFPHYYNMKQKISVVKVGGAVIEDNEQIEMLLKDFAAISGKKILIHGGGRSATKIAASLGIESRMANGRRITDKAMLDVVIMVYGGLINKNIVALLQAQGVNALGLSGADMNLIRSHKRPLKDGIDFGYVGDIDAVDGNSLRKMVEENVVPVLSPLTHDGNGCILNTNADTIASETAKALAPFFDVTLVYCFEKKGVLASNNDDDVVPVITHSDFKHYVNSGVIAGGMIPKIENAFAAIAAGVTKVVITQATDLNGKYGTVIVNEN